jgi:hypothetical protein
MFAEHTYAQSMVTGALFEKMDESKCDAKLLITVKHLLNSANSDELVYRQLDRFIVAYFLSCTGDAILDTLPWYDFTLLEQDVFTSAHLVDIGRNIRQIILGDLAADSFSRLIFFSLPYLKHNRLTLPPVGETRFADLQSCLRIMYASCLGMLQPQSKKPPWGIRVQLHVFTHQLLINATHKDLHTFFKQHLALLRISLIEYVIFFIRENMDIERRVFEGMFSAQDRSALQFDEMLHLINNFRIQAYDGPVLDTVRLNEKAMLMLERCNRMCTCKKNPTSIFDKAHASSAQMLAADLHRHFDIAFCQPLARSRLLLQAMHSGMSFSTSACIAQIQRSVSMHALPDALYTRQLRALKAMYDRHSLKAIYATRCCVCLFCGLKHGTLDDKMRIQDNGAVFCSGCDSSQYVMSVNTLGMLLKIRGVLLFWCPCCCIVHRWLATGYDCTACAYTRQPVPVVPKECLICKKRNGLEDVQVLEADAGFMCTLTLCYKHRPWDYQLKWVCDLDSLKHALQTKRNAKPLY